jgi:hypothetical protein
MKPFVAFSNVLLIALLAVLPSAASAQRSDARDDGAAARSDALTATPNRATPVPQVNLFPTAPRLEQQPGASTEKPGSRQSAPVEQKPR